MRTWITILTAALSVAAWGCDDSDGGSANGGGAGGGSASGGGATGGGSGGAALRVATYNGGLARGFVNFADERATLVAQAAGSLDLDLFCAQEFWETGDLSTLQQAAAARLPNHFELGPDPTGECASGCTDAEIAPLVSCVDMNCPDVSPDMLLGCGTMNCQPQVDDLSEGCLGCIAANLGGSIQEISDTCVGGGDSCYAYGGSFGTSLMSAFAFEETDSLVFSSSLNRRAALYGRINHPTLGTLHVFCTHLTAGLSNVPYPGPGSWEMEQATQVSQLIDWMSEKAGADGKVILMGDLNTGVAAGDRIAAELPSNYEPFLAAGFRDDFTDSENAECTFCFDNPLVGGVDRSESVLIDHVFTRNIDSTGVGEVILKDPITIEVDGMMIETAYSDHYGLEVTYSP